MNPDKTVASISKKLQAFRQDGLRIGLVPTMGALHRGHLSLVEFALKDNDKVVVSIFVNPTQFDNASDLKHYPRTLNRDVDLLKTVDPDNILVFAPSVEEVYPEGQKSESFDFGGIATEMEGAFRTGHFDGVGTVVKRLLQIVKPDKAYFGEKDFQQLQIIKKLVKIARLDADIKGVPIFREDSGLAMSSRNERLQSPYREASPFIYKTLKTARRKFGTESAKKVTEWVQNEFDAHELLKLEYFMIADARTLKPVVRKSKRRPCRAFIAAYAGAIRLIDNIALN